ncbi:helix-turn-helix domain-containing protein [Pigmentiphaga soli]|uniref:Helix-turn-helix domain-containing protein n=1 Tax=Pigmentiphaga soli TaxID=1007095 RepID=A0ABP8GSN3_9BURK
MADAAPFPAAFPATDAGWPPWRGAAPDVAETPRRAPAVPAGGHHRYLPTSSFDSRHFSSGAEAFRAWCDAIAGLFDVAPAGGLASFHARMQTYRLGSMLLGSVESAPQQFSRPAALAARGGVDHYMVQAFRRGGCRGDAGGRAVQVKAGDVALFDMTRPVSCAAQGFRYTLLVIPRPILEPLLDRPDAAHGLVIRGDTAAGRILSEHLVSVCARAAQLSAAQGQMILQGSAAMIAGCAGPASGAAETAASDLRRAALDGIKRHVEAHLGSPELCPDEICRRFGVSRPTLFRLFTPYGGFSHYLRERRLRRCFGEITSPQHAHRRIGDIAGAWGFQNEAAFSRAFRRLFGASAREVRQAFLGDRRPGD